VSPTSRSTSRSVRQRSQTYFSIRQLPASSTTSQRRSALAPSSVRRSLGGLLLVVFRFDISGRHDAFRQHSLNCSAPVCLFFPFHFPK